RPALARRRQRGRRRRDPGSGGARHRGEAARETPPPACPARGGLAAAGGRVRDAGVTPLATPARLRAGLEARWRRGETPSVVVIGGGNSGCEVAAAIAQLAVRRAGAARVALLADNEGGL